MRTRIVRCFPCLALFALSAQAVHAAELLPQGRLESFADWRLELVEGKVRASVGTWPNGWAANVWDGVGTARVELARAPDLPAADKAFRLVNLSPGVAGQIYPGSDVPLPAAGVYLLKLSVRAEGGGEGQFALFLREGRLEVLGHSQNTVYATSADGSGFDFDVTAAPDRWDEVTVRVRVAQDSRKLALMLRNRASGVENPVFYRALSVTAEGAKR